MLTADLSLIYLNPTENFWGMSHPDALMYRCEYKVMDFLCLDQFFATAFAQLTCRESLRDIEVNLHSSSTPAVPQGFRCQTISRNTLANANATRSWQIHAGYSGRA